MGVIVPGPVFKPQTAAFPGALTAASRDTLERLVAAGACASEA